MGDIENHKNIKMHRLILKCDDDQVVDHIYHHLNDNRKSQIRIATHLHIPDREPRLHGVLAPPCRKGAPLFHEQF